MNYNFIKIALALGGFSLSAITFAQTPTDELMMPIKEICFLANYEYGEFDQYWEGTTLRENRTIAKVQRRTSMLMGAYGITDKLNVYLGAPFVKTNSTIPNGGKFAGTSGIQDLTVALKYKAFQKVLGGGEFSGYASLAFSIPLTNYLSDYQPYSIGIGAPQLNWRAILHYRWNNGIYLRATGAYLWKGYTEAEREYYYNDGSYYTSWMDVPNAWNFEVTAGKWFLENLLRAELSYSSMQSTSGDDIRAYNAPQPTNKVDMGRVGAFVHYYFKKPQGLGLLVYHNRIVNGRNAPEMASTGVGVTYQFSLLSSKN